MLAFQFSLVFLKQILMLLQLVPNNNRTILCLQGFLAP